ncbi:ATP-binding protein [Geotalea toluenoxydans]|uniref:ATP-binding protein n=1 Tax=Geotalea toluenoxydans TaxID=421624 RepID=UPI0006D26ED9|nr:AAA family ATPase [Geotalea toluenoxydans]
MHRLIDKELKRWKDGTRRKPLILRGARQVGKTWSLKDFGKKCFESLALVDLERNPQLRGLFDADLSASRICADLEVLLRQKITPGQTLLFFDEIQACPRAITALRYFYEEMPELHVVAAGSLLEFALKEASFPVGRIQFLNLYPLCFAEYLEAIGNAPAAAAVLSDPAGITPAVHELLREELKRYFFIGGMPAAVKAYAERGSLKEAFEVQGEIAESFRLDFAKYTPQVDRYCLDAVFTALAQAVGQQIKYARLATGYAQPTMKKAFDALCLAQVARRVPSVDPSGLPLGASASAKLFKALMLDLGLMRYLSGMPDDIEYARGDLLAMYRGAMAEQFVGQEMLVSQNGSLYYWDRPAKSSSAEIDYLAVLDGRIHPVEVKSGAAGSLRSLHLFLATYPECGNALVFSDRPYANLPEQRITFLPLYSAFATTGGKVVSDGANGH